MERNNMQKKYVNPSVEVVDLYAEQGVMLQGSDTWHMQNYSQKRKATTTSTSSGIWNNSMNE